MLHEVNTKARCSFACDDFKTWLVKLSPAVKPGRAEQTEDVHHSGRVRSGGLADFALVLQVMRSLVLDNSYMFHISSFQPLKKN